MAALASDLLRHFRLLLWNRWTKFNETWQGSKILTSSTKFVFFGPMGKTGWLPWPLIGWDILDFSSETAERNSMKLGRKQDLNILYQVCVFWADRKIRWPPWPLIGWDIFDFSSETAEQNSTILDKKKDLNVLYQVCVFWADRKNRTAALGNLSKRWHIVLRCTISGPLGLLFNSIFQWFDKFTQLTEFSGRKSAQAQASLVTVVTDTNDPKCHN